MLMAQTRSKIIFLRPKVSQYTEKKFPTLIFMALALRKKMLHFLLQFSFKEAELKISQPG